MKSSPERGSAPLQRLSPTRAGAFAWQTLKSFRRNQGMLLSGAVAYYALLSIVPLMALLLIALSHVMDETALTATVRSHLQLVVPMYADTLTNQVSAFLQYRQLVGWIGLLVVIFFSTMAFTVLENAMSVIFFHRVNIHRRHFMISALIPFAFILLVGSGILVVTLVSGALQGLDQQHVDLLGATWQLSGLSGAALYALGVIGLALLLTSLYLVMPVGRIAFRHALAGGIIAALLWEISRHLIVWYFTQLSLVNLVYGSMTTTVVVLFSFEIAAVIVLFGAQIIAELEQGQVTDSGGMRTS